MSSSSSLQAIPLEISTLIARFMDYNSIKMSDNGNNNHDVVVQPAMLLSPVEYWHKRRRLCIKSRNHLVKILRDRYTRDAHILDLASSDIDNVDLDFIAKHFYKIFSLNLQDCTDVTDDGLEEILQIHGCHLTSLNLTRSYKLSNQTLEYITKYCTKLKILILDGGMFTSNALREMIVESTFRLKTLSLSRCYLLDTKEIPAMTRGLEKIRNLNLSHLDPLAVYQVQVVLKECPTLQRLNIKGCPDFTLKSIRELQVIHPHVNILNDAKLEDHSIEGVRRFLIGLVNIQ